MIFAGANGGNVFDLMQLPDGQISWPFDRLILCVQPRSQNFSALPVGQIISTSPRHPDPPEGRFAIVTNVGRDAVDAFVPEDERHDSGR
jgi:hypothetical protein